MLCMACEAIYASGLPKLPSATTEIGVSAAESPRDHGAACDGKADDTRALQATFDAGARTGQRVYIPVNCTLSIHGELRLPSATQLTLDGALKGAGGRLNALGDLTASGTGSIGMTDDGSGHVFGIRVQQGRVTISGIRFVSDGDKQLNEAILIAPTAEGISTLDIHDVYFSKVQFGILRDSSTAAHTVQFAEIHHNQFFDLSGDAIEWNIGYGDGQLSIADNRIDLVHGKLVNQGIGIGVAGEGPYADVPIHAQDRISIVHNTVRRVRQALHCEVCVSAEIDDNKITEVDPMYGSDSIDVAAIQLVGSYDSSVSRNHISESGRYGTILIMAGVIQNRFIPSGGQNIIVGNQVIGAAGILDICTWQAPSPNHQAVESIIRDNIIVRGTIRHTGVCSYTLIGNDVLSPAGENGLNLDLGAGRSPNERGGRFVVELERNHVRDADGKVQINLKDFSDPYFQHVLLLGEGNNFAMPAGSEASRQDEPLPARP